MSGKAIGKSLGFGYAGNFSRMPDSIVEALPVASDSDNILFGQPVVLNSDGTLDAPTSTALTAANFAGVALAQVKQFNTYITGQDQTQQGYFSPDQMCDVIQRGIVSVKVAYGTPTAGGAVYVRTALNVAFPDEVVGDFRTASDTTNTVQLTNCCWRDAAIDANGIAELKIKTVNN